MERLEHLKLPVFKGKLPRQKNGGGGFENINNRSKVDFGITAIEKANSIYVSHASLKSKFSNTSIDPSLIFELEINQGVDVKSFQKILLSMGLRVLSIAENKQGFWVVFSDDEYLEHFKTKIKSFAEGTQIYDFFKAIEKFQEIPIEKKIGSNLTERPLSEEAEFVDIELWKIENSSKNEDFISQLSSTYTDKSIFEITDSLIARSIVLLRVKLTRSVFDDIIELKEIARIERPTIPQFNSWESSSINISDFDIQKPSQNAAGILIIDSGILSNHPMLEKCVGDEQNFQDGETEIHDTVGHGTSVAGCATYNNLEKCIVEKRFVASNWIFSAKVMYAESNFHGNSSAVYDQKKLVENQLKNAVEYFLDNYEQIKVVNISFGNSYEVWHKNYERQLPLAAIIDELAYENPQVVFIVSAGNGCYDYNSIADAKDHYPDYLFSEDNRIINPATSALALTVGSIAQSIRRETPRLFFGDENIVVPIAEENQPSPFTRIGGGINKMVKPELVEYGGNLLLKQQNLSIVEDKGGKIQLLNNSTTDKLMKFDRGTSFSAPKVANLVGQLANLYPHSSADFLKNLLLVGASYPFKPTKEFYDTEGSTAKDKALKKHLQTSGYGLSSLDKAISSYKNRVVLWDENKIKLDDIIAYSFKLPALFFNERGKKRIMISLTFTPETRSSRGDSYLGNIMEFHVFHTLDAQTIVDKYASNSNRDEVPYELKKYEMKDFFPGIEIRKRGCHQKAVKEFSIKPKWLEEGPLTLIVVNKNKWIVNESYEQGYCLSLILEHDHEIDLYNEVRTNIQIRTRIR